MAAANESDFKAKALIDIIAKELKEEPQLFKHTKQSISTLKAAKNGAELVKKINAVYRIKVLKGDKVGTWVIDVKNGNGSIRYDSAGRGDVTFTMDDDNWLNLMTGKLTPQQAYFNGHMKLSGNLGLAMQLENILKPQHLQSKL